MKIDELFSDVRAAVSALASMNGVGPGTFFMALVALSDALDSLEKEVRDVHVRQ